MGLQSCGSRVELERELGALELRIGEKMRLSRELVSDTNADAQVANVSGMRAKLDTAFIPISALDTLLNATSSGASDVLHRLTAARVNWERARILREYVNDTADFRELISSIRGAMDVGDWDRAAVAASKARAIREEVRLGAFAGKMVPSSELPDPPNDILTASCEQMSKLFAQKFDNATKERQMSEVTRFFKLFPLIGDAKTGLMKYSSFVRQIIAGTSRTLIRGLDSSNPKIYGLAMSRLFENLAMIVQQHAPIVEKNYGNAMPVVLEAIQSEIDSQGCLIIDTLWDERRLERVLADCRTYSYPFLVQAFTGNLDTNITLPNETEEEFLQASNDIAELSLLISRWSLYQQFITDRWSEAKANLDESSIYKKVTELLVPTYSTLTLYVFRRSVEKAIRLDAIPRDNFQNHDEPVTSSIVDDVMYVLNTLLIQALDTGNSIICEQVSQSFRRVLESDYLGISQRKLNEASEKDHCVYLNNIQTSIECIIRITSPYKGLEKMTTGFRVSADELLDEGCARLVRSFGPKLRNLCSAEFKGNFLLTPSNPESYQSMSFAPRWRAIMQPYRNQLHHSVFQNIIERAAEIVAKGIEQWIWSLKGKINELGAIALDRDIGKIVSTVAESNYSLRKKFAYVQKLIAVISDSDSTPDPSLSQEDILKMRSLLTSTV